MLRNHVGAAGAGLAFAQAVAQIFGVLAVDAVIAIYIDGAGFGLASAVAVFHPFALDDFQVVAHAGIDLFAQRFVNLVEFFIGFDKKFRKAISLVIRRGVFVAFTGGMRG